MKTIAKLFIILFSNLQTEFYAQLNSTKINQDTLIDFSDLSIWTENDFRVVPNNSLKPLYVSTSHYRKQNKKYEYFRIDSLTYLRQEYFENDSISSNEGIKSIGNFKVSKNIIGKKETNTLDIFSLKEIQHTYHFTKLIKDGAWEEYEDSTFNHIYWKGNYIQDKRYGLWKKLIYAGGDDYLLYEVDYSKDKNKLIYTSNVTTNSQESLFKNLIGRWNLKSCQDNAEHRLIFSKCIIKNNQYCYECNESDGKKSYFEFKDNYDFIRQRGEGCNEYQEENLIAKWIWIGNGKEFEIKFLNNNVWKFKILYLDNENNLIIEKI